MEKLNEWLAFIFPKEDLNWFILLDYKLRKHLIFLFLFLVFESVVSSAKTLNGSSLFN